MAKMKVKTNQDLIAEDNEIARSLGLDYGTYKAYVESGYISHYIRMRFHQDVERKSDDVIVERSWIGGDSNGRHHTAMEGTKI